MSSYNTIKEITADIRELHGTADAISQNAEAFRDCLQKLETCLSQLRAVWTGEASALFQLGASSDIEKMRTVCDTLDKLAADYGFAANEYEKNGQKAEEILKAVNGI